MADQEPVDVAALIERVYAAAQSEYTTAYKRLEQQERDHNDRVAGWHRIVGRLQPHYSGPLSLAVDLNLEKFVERLDEIVKAGLDFEQIIAAVKTNEMVKAQWDKTLMTMRLVDLGNTAVSDDNE